MSNGLQQVINYMIPAVGTPRSYFWTGVLDATPVTIDFRNVNGGNIDGQPFRPSGVFIDNTLGTGPLTVVINEISYQMVCLAGELLNLQFPAPTDISVSFVGNGQATLAFVDFPVLPYRNLAVAGGTALWGAIGGILSDQADLQSALDAKITNPAGAVDGEALIISGGVPQWLPIPASSVTWGSITGTLSDQTDLQTALNAKITDPGGAVNGEVLTISAGSPQWLPPAGGGSGAPWENIATWTFSTAVANVDFINLGAYTELKVVGRNITMSASSIQGLLVSHDNGATFPSVGPNYVEISAAGVPSGAAFFSTHTTATTSPRNFIVELEGINMTSTFKMLRASGGPASVYEGSSAPIDAIRIFGTAGANLTGGTIELYGRR